MGLVYVCVVGDLSVGLLVSVFILSKPIDPVILDHCSYLDIILIIYPLVLSYIPVIFSLTVSIS